MKTFSVGWILETLAANEGINLVTEGIDDICFGMVISSDKTALQVFRDNSSVYNYQIVDGDPIRLVRRAVNDSLVIDFEINETDCIRRSAAPAAQMTRVDPATLPKQVEIQYIDPGRDYAVTTQVARHTAAPRTNTQISVPIDFVISAQQARDMAFDLLYRIWSQQMTINFEHKDLTIEPGDTVRLTTGRGTFIILVHSNIINMPARSNSVTGTILLTTKGTSIVTAPEADPFSHDLPNHFTINGTGAASFVGSGGVEVLTSNGVAAVSWVSNGDDDAFLLVIE